MHYNEFGLRWFSLYSPPCIRTPRIDTSDQNRSACQKREQYPIVNMHTDTHARAKKKKKKDRTHNHRTARSDERRNDEIFEKN